MRQWKELSVGEQQYLNTKTTGWKIASFFAPGIGQIWSKRRGLFWGGIGISAGLGLLGYIAGGGNAIEGAGLLSWLINVILTLVGFTEKAYSHDMLYFQRYLDEYDQLGYNDIKSDNDTKSTGHKPLRKWEELTDEEKKYIDNELSDWKATSVFLPTLGQIRCKRRGLLCVGLLLILGLPALYLIQGFPIALGFIGGYIINIILTLISFTEYAYKSDPTYFQKYLNRINGEKVKIDKQDENEYDKYGFNKKGYNREGFDVYGFDKDGYNREGYNEEGYDKYGYDKDGYNYKGYDKDGYNKEGINKFGKKKISIKKTISTKSTSKKANGKN